MSFTTEILDVMTSDPSLNAWVDGGIHYENLLDNWLGETDDDKWILYESRKSAQGNCIDNKNVYMNYQLSVIVIQRNTNDEIDTITNRLVDYLNNHESGNIYDIVFLNDQSGFNQQQGIYTNTLEFECVYLET